MSQPAALSLPFAQDAAGAITTGTAASRKVAGWTNKAVQLLGSGWAATLTIEGRLAGGTWAAINAAVTAIDQTDTGVIPIPEDVEEIRSNISAATTPDPSFGIRVIGIDHGRGH